MRPRYLMLAVFLVALAIAPTVAQQLGLFPRAQDPTSSITSTRAADLLSPQVSSRLGGGDSRSAPSVVLAQASLTATLIPARRREASVSTRDTSSSSTQAEEPAMSLPPEEAELSPSDGLPATGMRCSFDGGAFQCGACRTDSDCPAGSGCIANRETRRFECLESECEEDAHCFPGLVCRPVTTGATGPLIRRCVPSGVRREGEPCDGLFISPAGACQEGLTCHRGVCSRPCRLGVPASCPEGLTCEEGTNGPACFPDCRARGCPEGQQCKHLGDTDYQCLSEVKGECPEKPCAAGERCNLRLSRGRGVFWCAALCDPLRADSCPADQVCGMGSATLSTCYRRCDPMAPDSCGAGWQCTTVSEDMTQWGCSPVASP